MSAAMLPREDRLGLGQGYLADPAGDRERSRRRAKGQARRYGVSNACTQLVTFTYRHGEPCAECGSTRPRYSCNVCRRRAKRDCARLLRRLRRRGYHLPSLRVLESHADGSIHVHAALGLPTAAAALRFSDRVERATRWLAALWGEGFVDVAKPRRGVTARERARKAAAYVTKYVVKALDGGELDPGEHAYEVTQGFSPLVSIGRAFTRRAAIRWAIAEMGGEVPAYTWSSSEDETHRGPPVWFGSWD